jgi:hypothetical protein
VTCVLCNGRNSAGCTECGGKGYRPVIGCPRRLVTADAYELLDAADWAKHGSWPVAGGWLEQTCACVSGVRYVEGERAAWEIDRMEELARIRQQR